MNSNAVIRGLTLALVATPAVAAVPFFSSPASAAGPARTLVATSTDGAAFDLDEYDAGDVTVQVTDSVLGAVDVDDAQDLQYHWTVDPFDPLAPSVRVPALGEDVADTDVAGEFVVPLPALQGSGTYVLVAGLGPDALAAGAIPSAQVLSVKTGEAEVVFDDEDPLLVAAGADHPVAGSLALEDGTGLPDRLVDVTFTQGTAGTDPEADAGLVPVLPDTALVSSLQVTTSPDGVFDVVLSDPAEAGQGTELGGTLGADTATTPGIGDADAGAALAVELVSEVAPSGSTMVIDPLGGGTPGQALTSRVMVTAPDDTFDVDPATPGVQGDADTDRDLVEGQRYSLTLDHGFFTTGDEVLPSVVDDPAGTLVDLGDSLDGLTDAAGEVPFAVSIGRDAGFDADGLVTATVSAEAGDLTAQKTAAWSSADPLNGHVEVVLSPQSEQVAAVAPAVMGNRTYFEVVALDQFDNPVSGAPVDLTYSGDTDDWDYSDDFVVSDLDASGDIWIVSFEPGDIVVTATWNAPTYRYTDTAGNAVADVADVTGANTASFYEIDFLASKFSIRKTPQDVAEVGTAVTHTVTVIDQEGNPVRGFRVQFFRFGPDTSDGEPRATRQTNSLGQATYTFVGTKLGRARITAEVTDGTRSRTLTSIAVFGRAVRAQLAGTSNGKKADELTVAAQRYAAGAKVTLFRVIDGKRHAVRFGRLDATGAAAFTVPDRNGARRTNYVAVVRSTPTTVAAESNTVRVR